MNTKYLLLFPVLMLVAAGCVQTKQVDYSKPLQQLSQAVNDVGGKIDGLEKRVDELEVAKSTKPGWTTHQYRGDGFSISLPDRFVLIDRRVDSKVHLFFGEENQREKTDIAEDDMLIEVKIDNWDNDYQWDGTLDTAYLLDQVSDEYGELGDQRAKIFRSSGNCDGPGCGSAYVAYLALQGLTRYELFFYYDKQLSNLEQEILESFFFTQ